MTNLDDDWSTIQLMPLRWWRDWRFCWRLANDAAVRRASLTQERPTWRSHLRWLWRWRGPRLAVVPGRAWHQRRAAWIVGHPAVRRPLGLLRWSWNAHLRGWEVHIALVSWMRGRGVGPAVLRVTSQSMWLEASPHAPLYARIRSDNTGSIRAFGQAGYGELRREWSAEGGGGPNMYEVVVMRYQHQDTQETV